MLNKSLKALILDKLNSNDYSCGRDTIFVKFCSHFGVKLKTNIDDAESALDTQKNTIRLMLPLIVGDRYLRLGISFTNLLIGLAVEEKSMFYMDILLR